MIGRSPYRALEKALGYRFRRRGHLETALTHRSFRFENGDQPADNQRLEFLGDAALGLVAASHFFAAHPDAEEGLLTRIRSRLTNSQALAQIAGALDLGAHLRLGRGEQQCGGHQRGSTLGDALEAVLGAAYLDGGLKAVEKIFRQLFLPAMERLAQDLRHDNPKGTLQEYAQRTWRLSPRYVLLREEGPAHARVFTVEVCLPGEVRGEGRGSSKQLAEMAAAAEALSRLPAVSYRP